MNHLVKEFLIFLGYVISAFIYWKYNKKIRKIINKILPFLVFQYFVGTLFAVIIRVSLK
nr:MAG TPA: hypothetical protein [Caudoviricetes sp.]